MGKSKIKSNYIFISGFDINNNNRGTAALGYGSIGFLDENGILDKKSTIVNIRKLKVKGIIKRILKLKNPFQEKRTIIINEKEIKYKEFYILNIEEWLQEKNRRIANLFRYWKIINKIKLVAAINGGDGFSDIYGVRIFRGRLDGIKIAMKYNIPLMMLPQTIGPFKSEEIKEQAIEILKYAKWIFVRDEKFIDALNMFQLKYEITKDLSYYMKPEPWKVDVPEGSVGINVSGLALSNNFPGLQGQFDSYPQLIKTIISFFQKKGKNIFLIPHSYNYWHPEKNNDDLEACKTIYDEIEDKTNIVLVSKDMISPQIKYLISKMSFFIGTRMHANFAAIYTNVPVFGLAYSYKFEAGFNANGLDGKRQTAKINNISNLDVKKIVEKIEYIYDNTK